MSVTFVHPTGRTTLTVAGCYLRSHCNKLNTPTTIYDVRPCQLLPASQFQCIRTTCSNNTLSELGGSCLTWSPNTILTAAEIDESATDAQTSGTGFDDTTQNTTKTVLMHLVFQKPLPPTVAVPPAAEPAKDPKHTAVSDSGCGCAVM